MVLKNLYYITDHYFYIYGDRVYSDATIPLDAITAFGNYNNIIIHGRIRESAYGEEVINSTFLFNVSNPQIKLVGTIPKEKGNLLGFLNNIKILKKNIGLSDIIWLKLPYLSSIVAFPFIKKKQLIITQMIGNPKLNLIHIKNTSIVTATIYSKLAQIVLNKGNIISVVSKNLEEEFVDFNKKTLIINETKLSINNLYKKKSLGNKNILFVGRISPEKGIITLIYSFEKLKKQGYDINLTIVGEGPLKSEAINLVNSLGISNSVKFIGKVQWGEDLFNIYKEADIFVLPSRTEGLGLVLLEAMCFSVPIVAANVGGIPSLVKHDYNGFLFNSNSSEELFLQIEKLIGSEEIRKEFVENSYSVFERNTKEMQMEKLITIVNEEWAKRFE